MSTEVRSHGDTRLTGGGIALPKVDPEQGDAVRILRSLPAAMHVVIAVGVLHDLGLTR